jgi:hypothetical protein
VTDIVSRCPDYHDQPVPGEAEGKEAVLTIIVPPILKRERWPFEDRAGVREIKPALRQCPGTFVLIEAYAMFPPDSHRTRLLEKGTGGKK